MMGKQQNLHINLHSSHLTKRNSLYVRYLQIDTADLKSADLNRSWGFKSPSGHHHKSFIINSIIGLYPILLGVSDAMASSTERRYAHSKVVVYSDERLPQQHRLATAPISAD